MTENNSPKTDLKARLSLRLLLLALLMNGSTCTRVPAPHSCQDGGVSPPDKPGRSHRVEAPLEGEAPIRWETRDSESGSLRRAPEEGVEKGGGGSPGRSLKFRLGERFAFRKRLQFALLPIMYKMGVMTTLLTGLTVLVLKGLTIGVILLIFAFGNYFTKLHKHSYQSAQPIHVHVHSPDGHGKVAGYPSVVGPWDRTAEEVHPSAFLGDDDDLESYRRRLIQNSAAMVKFKPLSI